MNTTLWSLITISFIVAVAVLAFVMVELRGAIKALKELIKTADCSLKPTMDELQMTLKSVRNITDNITTVTEDVKVLSGSVRDIGNNVKEVSGLVEELTSSTVAKVSGLRAGINAAIEVFLKNLFGRGR